MLHAASCRVGCSPAVQTVHRPLLAVEPSNASGVVPVPPATSGPPSLWAISVRRYGACYRGASGYHDSEWLWVRQMQQMVMLRTLQRLAAQNGMYGDTGPALAHNTKQKHEARRGVARAGPAPRRGVQPHADGRLGKPHERGTARGLRRRSWASRRSCGERSWGGSSCSSGFSLVLDTLEGGAADQHPPPSTRRPSTSDDESVVSSAPPVPAKPRRQRECAPSSRPAHARAGVAVAQASARRARVANARGRGNRTAAGEDGGAVRNPAFRQGGRG